MVRPAVVVAAVILLAMIYLVLGIVILRFNHARAQTIETRPGAYGSTLYSTPQGVIGEARPSAYGATEGVWRAPGGRTTHCRTTPEAYGRTRTVCEQ